MFADALAALKRFPAQQGLTALPLQRLPALPASAADLISATIPAVSSPLDPTGLAIDLDTIAVVVRTATGSWIAPADASAPIAVAGLVIVTTEPTPAVVGYGLFATRPLLMTGSVPLRFLVEMIAGETRN